MKICPVCETEFQPRGRQIYCERRCQLKAHFQRLKADKPRYEKFLANGRASYARHPETSALYALNWRATHRERVRANVRGQSARRRARVIETDRAGIAEYVAILRADPCAYCGGTMTVVDHIEAIAAGGRHEPGNLTAACRSCNARKRTIPLLHFMLRAKAAASP